jgi:hypothetical protein
MAVSRIHIYITISLLLCCLYLRAQNVQKPEYTSADSATVERITAMLTENKALTTGELMIKAGQQLLGVPYVGATLEKGDREHLVIQLSALDCTTFAENCLALARSSKSSTPGFAAFENELLTIRYRNGKLNDYTSRLHYFSDWIADNSSKAIVEDVSCSLSARLFTPEVYFMSRNSVKYRQMKDHPEYVKQIAAQEQLISKRKLCFIPKNEFAGIEHLLRDGDILGITTRMAGLDIQHVVLAIRVRNRIHILHASQRFHRVMISTETLDSYLKNNKTATGIVVARPL